MSYQEGKVGGAVSVPVPRNKTEMKEDIKEKIASEKFNLGIPVLDNEYTKVVLTSEETLGKKSLQSFFLEFLH